MGWEMGDDSSLGFVETHSPSLSVSSHSGASHVSTTQGLFRKQKNLRLTYEPTAFNQEWRTPPLWGVADSAPYMHDGRAETLSESIVMHDGEAAGTRDRFLNLSFDDRQAIIAFLNTLVAPPSAPQP